MVVNHSVALLNPIAEGGSVDKYIPPKFTPPPPFSPPFYMQHQTESELSYMITQNLPFLASHFFAMAFPHTLFLRCFFFLVSANLPLHELTCSYLRQHRVKTTRAGPLFPQMLT